MNSEKLETFKSELRADIRRLTAALAALEDNGTVPASIPTPTSASATSTAPAQTTHRKLSPETRRKISKSMKANWTRGKRKGRTLSPAVKEKIAKAQKARWARQKAAAQTVAATPAQAAA